MDCPASGFWHFRQCQGWADSYGVGLTLDQPLVSHSHNLYDTLTPGHPIGRTDYRLKVMWPGWYPNRFNGSLVWSQKMASSGYAFPIARTLSCGHPCRFLGVSLAPGFYLTLKCPPFSQSTEWQMRRGMSDSTIFFLPFKNFSFWKFHTYVQYIFTKPSLPPISLRSPPFYNYLLIFKPLAL